MASLNQALKQLGYRNGVHYRLEDEAGEIVMQWLGPGEEPTPQQIATAKAVVDARLYRFRRKGAYIARLGEDGTFENTVGDVLDALIRQVEIIRMAVGATLDAEFGDILEEIAAIKAEFPKPGGA